MADKTFGDNLSKSRKKAGLSQEELAEKMGLTRQTISKWETGASAPDVEGITAAVRGPVGQCGGADLWGKRAGSPNGSTWTYFRVFFYGFLVVMFITGACVRMANQISIETYHTSITTAARVMMLVPVVVFFSIALFRLFRKKSPRRTDRIPLSAAP